MSEKLFFQKECGTQRTTPMLLPSRIEDERIAAQDYCADENLVYAVNAALLLGRPLLLTGEPGTGKTLLASAIAHQLGYGEIERFVAKSTSEASHLFYTYDALARLRDASHVRSRAEYGHDTDNARLNTALHYLRYNALGRAILRANPPDRIQHLLPPGMQNLTPGRSVVLIDEIDKAPYDLPNDVLSEFERMEFEIPELGERVSATPSMRPVLVITSNSEKSLPDAFMRRCVYFHICFPERDALHRILQRRMKDSYDADFANDALDLLLALRIQADLTKPPATDELIVWMSGLKRLYKMETGKDSKNPLEKRSLGLRMIGALIKNKHDQDKAKPCLQRWVNRTSEPR